MTVTKIHCLHLVMGEIGGVGKSWFTKMLIEAYINLKLDYFVVDCDETTPNVGRAYDRTNYDPAYLAKYDLLVAKATEDLKPLLNTLTDAGKFLADAPKLEKKAQAAHDKEMSAATADVLAKVKNAAKDYQVALAAYEKAKLEQMPSPPRKPIYFISEDMDSRDRPSFMLGMAMEKDTIVNLPAQVTKVVNSWIQDSGLLLMKEYGLKTICWFVGKPSQASIDQLRNLHSFHDGQLQIVLVKNNFVGHAGNWVDILDDVMVSFLKNAGIISIDINDLRLNDEQRKLIDREYAVFSELIDPEDDRLLFHEKMKIRQYLDKTIATVIDTGLLPGSASEQNKPTKAAKGGDDG